MKHKIFLFLLVFSLMFSSVCFGAGTVGTVPSEIYPLPDTSVDYKYTYSFIFLDWDGDPSKVNDIKYVVYGSDEPFTMNSYIHANQDTYSTIRNVPSIKVRKQQFTYSNGSWGDNGTSDASADPVYGMNTHQFKVLYNSTVDIKTSSSSSEIFFTAPLENPELYQIIQRVTEQGLENNLTLAGTIRILVLCGVGLIALLMVLNLFGKVFNHYRN